MTGDRGNFLEEKDIATVRNVIEAQKFIKSVTKIANCKPQFCLSCNNVKLRKTFFFSKIENKNWEQRKRRVRTHQHPKVQKAPVLLGSTSHNPAQVCISSRHLWGLTHLSGSAPCLWLAGLCPVPCSEVPLASHLFLSSPLACPPKSYRYAYRPYNLWDQEKAQHKRARKQE